MIIILLIFRYKFRYILLAEQSGVAWSRMQKCAVLPGKMQKSGAEFGKTNVFVFFTKAIKVYGII